MKRIIKRINAVIACIVIVACITGVSVRSVTFPSVSAESAILIDADTRKVLFSKNSEEVRPVASLTKIMSTILTLEAGDLERKFRVDNKAIHVEGTSMGLKENYIVTRRVLCCGMMLPSGNDAANAAAVSVSGKISEFVKLMNKKAKQIGMKNTSYANPHGLDQKGHVSTAYDMALLTAYALSNEEFRTICSSKTIAVEFGEPPHKRTLSNNNKMLWGYEGCIGVKTGFTDNARRCLITAAEKDGRTLIAVTLNAPDDWNDHTKMLDYGFAITEII